jgi:hypothetical protein
MYACDSNIDSQCFRVASMADPQWIVKQFVHQNQPERLCSALYKSDILRYVGPPVFASVPRAVYKVADWGAVHAVAEALPSCLDERRRSEGK